MAGLDYLRAMIDGTLPPPPISAGPDLADGGAGSIALPRTVADSA
jgi:hypothetical protein